MPRNSTLGNLLLAALLGLICSVAQPALEAARAEQAYEKTKARRDADVLLLGIRVNGYVAFRPSEPAPMRSSATYASDT